MNYENKVFAMIVCFWRQKICEVCIGYEIANNGKQKEIRQDLIVMMNFLDNANSLPRYSKKGIFINAFFFFCIYLLYCYISQLFFSCYVVFCLLFCSFVFCFSES